ncbi:MAG: VPA1269 family protein [Cellvibrio sp.]|uniref:gamma-mobile-trio integrase GmtZ n=1 Tax=Cellvibrio sp. TaxID=1965322 RepID=UPI0031B2356D
MVKPFLYQTIEEARIASKALGITSQSEYNKLKKKDPKLPSNPQTFYKDWVNWYHYLSKTTPEFYESYADASAATQKLGIKSAVAYEKKYMLDPRLPSRPLDTYKDEWHSWLQYCGKVYSTTEEVISALKKLNIRTYAEYKVRRKEDKKLPPERRLKKYYGDGVHTALFGSFLYPTLDEATAAARAIKINSYDSYQKLRHQDPRLPASPEVYYKDFINWYAFLLNYYPDAEKARSALKEHNVETLEQYNERRLVDRALPSKPHIHYGLKTFREFMEFRYLDLAETKLYCEQNNIKTRGEYAEHVRRNRYLRSTNSLPGYVNSESILVKKTYFDSCPNEYAEWVDLARKWSVSGTSLDRKREVTKSFINNYLCKFNHPTSPGPFFHFQHEAGNISHLFENNSNQKTVINKISLLNDFLNYVLETSCGEIDDDTGDLYILPGYKNPFLKSSTNFIGSSTRPSESVKPILPYSLVVKARDWIVPTDAQNFSNLIQVRGAMEADWFEVPPYMVDKNDPDCVWRVIERFCSSKRKAFYYQLWSPVRSIAMYTLLQVPLRGQQVLWLDSGEADEWIPQMHNTNEKIIWEKNPSSMVMQGNAKGFVKRFVRHDTELSGMNITTNKSGTGGQGYDVSWIPMQLAYWIIKLRNWQAKYNPISTPTKWTEISLPRTIDKAVLDARGTQTFLFRDPTKVEEIKSHSPMSTNQAFGSVLPCVLWNIQSEKLPLATKQGESGALATFSSEYTPHSLRVSLITSYILDGEIAVPFISKLVGHASIVMTIYYTKISQPEMARQFAEAEQKMFKKSADRIQDIFLAGKIDEARSELFSVTGDFINSLNEKWPRASYTFFDWGICAMSGAGCDQGGAKKEKGSGYEPVPKGFLGSQNCLHCRFLISGPAFLGGLTALANQIILSCNEHAEKLAQLELNIKRLDEEEFDLSESNTPFEKHSERVMNKDALARETTKLDSLTIDLIMCYRIANTATEILNKSNKGENRTQLIASDAQTFSIGLEETYEFNQLNNICKNADLYIFSNPSRAVPRRSQLFDHLLDNNGLAPVFFKLSVEDQLKAGNQIANLLQHKLGSQEKLDRAVKGINTLRELMDDESLKSCEVELVDILQLKSNGLQRSADRIGG